MSIRRRDVVHSLVSFLLQHPSILTLKGKSDYISIVFNITHLIEVTDTILFSKVRNPLLTERKITLHVLLNNVQHSHLLRKQSHWSSIMFNMHIWWRVKSIRIPIMFNMLTWWRGMSNCIPIMFNMLIWWRGKSNCSPIMFNMPTW